MKHTRVVTFVLFALALASTAVAATARAADYPGLKLRGVRVSAEPVVSIKNDALYTTSIVWKVREVYVDKQGAELEVWLHEGKKLVDNVSRNVKAKFGPEHMPFTRMFETREDALRAFRFWSKGGSSKDEPKVEPKREPTCREVMIETGHSASQVGYCTAGLPDWCAVAVLRAGGGASQVGYCNEPNLDRPCVEAMLKRGGSVAQIGYCRKP